MHGHPYTTSLLAPVVLRDFEPFAKGSKRHCYVHPANSAFCIKVVAQVDDWECHREQLTDLKNQAELKRRGGSVFDHFATIEGTVKTDLGVGLVCPLYRDANGRISSTLTDVVRERGLTRSLSRAVDELKEWLRDQRLLTRDTGPDNTLAIRLNYNDWKLIIIEGWLNQRYHRLIRLYPNFVDYLIRRQLRKFDRRLYGLIKTCSGGPSTPDP